jgi:hypothetical protein
MAQDSSGRAELPDGFRLARTAGPFDTEGLPAGLIGDAEEGQGQTAASEPDEGSGRLIA